MSKALKREFTGITDEALAELKGRIGVKIENTIEPWCYESTRDNIRHYAHGIGDDNPLWCNPDYAKKTRYKNVIAPPSFLFACSRIVSGYVGGLPGVHAMFAGCDFTWYEHMYRNDEISTEAYLKDLVEHETRFAGRSIQQIYHVDFYTQKGKKIAEGDTWCFRTDRDVARERGDKYDHVKNNRKIYKQEEIQAVWDMYAKEKVRGAKPRYWEDVKVGDKIPSIVKGPMTVTGFIAYAQGWGGLYIRANKLAYKLQKEHPSAGIKNAYGIPDCPERVHWEAEMAQRVGVPEAYDYGPERCSWASHLVTNWMGDDGFLRNLKTEIRRHNPAGDVIIMKGEVIKKYSENNIKMVDISLRGDQQEGELSIKGTATAVLPSKA
jgi:acyl dehydratase